MYRPLLFSPSRPCQGTSIALISLRRRWWHPSLPDDSGSNLMILWPLTCARLLLLKLSDSVELVQNSWASVMTSSAWWEHRVSLRPCSFQCETAQIHEEAEMGSIQRRAIKGGLCSTHCNKKTIAKIRILIIINIYIYIFMIIKYY
jgi:hypothetical protein